MSTPRPRVALLIAASVGVLAPVALPIASEAQQGRRTADGKPDLNGIWQALNSANWDLQDHPARAGMVVDCATLVSNCERRNKLRIGDRGESDASTCSNLNFSLQAMIGRQIVWSIRTITPIMTASPQRIARISPALEAVCR